MKSIQRRFNKIQEKNPYWSSIVCFNETIKEQGFSRKSIYYWFSKLIDKNDYQKCDKRDTLCFLLRLSEKSDEGIKSGKIFPKNNFFIKNDSNIKL